MTTTTLVNHTSDSELARRALLPIALMATAVAMTFSVLGANSRGEAIFEIGIQAVAAGLLCALVVPRALRHESAGGRGIVLGVLGLLLVVPAFWSGLPIQLGAAAALVGYAGKRAEQGSGRAVASLVLGLLVVVAYLAIYVSDFVSTHGIG